MGILNALRGTRIYLDTNIWIYALEGYQPFIANLTQLFQAIDDGALTAVTSELSLAEALVKPMQNQNIPQQEAYKQILSSSTHLLVAPVSRDLLINAAQLRASTITLKLPDAIHAATAQLHQCTTFLTNDQRFRSVPSLQVILLSQIS
ncbi:MAG: type II toxin-antitoxin system VapC family toxin [Cyanobacteriota bacterium]|nr:type II toxin-antitoxin system VapC family toxin [Cyanobacteriota bacterium]